MSETLSMDEHQTTTHEVAHIYQAAEAIRQVTATAILEIHDMVENLIGKENLPDWLKDQSKRIAGQTDIHDGELELLKSGLQNRMPDLAEKTEAA